LSALKRGHRRKGERHSPVAELADRPSELGSSGGAPTKSAPQARSRLAGRRAALHGVYDYTCSYSLAKSYFEQLKAPLKGFYTFEGSAHSPIFEEPEKTARILRNDVLAGANDLADQAPVKGWTC
jgi:pimeloyl-ACP methyl ester carboxylesterase